MSTKKTHEQFGHEADVFSEATSAVLVDELTTLASRKSIKEHLRRAVRVAFVAGGKAAAGGLQ